MVIVMVMVVGLLVVTVIHRHPLILGPRGHVVEAGEAGGRLPGGKVRPRLDAALHPGQVPRLALRYQGVLHTANTPSLTGLGCVPCQFLPQPFHPS